MNNVLKKTLFLTLMIVPFFLYFLTASRDLTWGDGAEFYVAAKDLGIAHPTGYPLFMLIGRIRYLLFPDPFMFNLLSGAFTAIAILFIGLIAHKMTQNKWLSISLALFFAFGRAVWQQSIVAEIYSFNLLFFVLMLFFILQIDNNNRAIPMIWFLSGLALTNHLTAIFYVLPFAVYLIIHTGRINRYIILAIIPLALYFYLPIRSRAQPVPDLFDPETLGNFINYVTARAFQYRSWSFATTGIGGDIVEFLLSCWYQFLIVIPLVFYGFFKIKSKGLRLLLLIILIMIAVYTISYDIPDKQGYYLPVYGIMIIYIAVALNKIIPERFKYLLLILPGISIAVNYNNSDLSADTTFNDVATAIYQDLPSNSIFISEDYFLYYGILDLEQQQKKDIIPVQQFYLCMDWYINNLRTVHPKLILPVSIDEYLFQSEQRLITASKKEYGDINKQRCFVIQKMLIEANIDSMTINYFIYDDSNWPDQWQGYPLSYHGLYYQFHRSARPRGLFNLQFKTPSNYRIDRMKTETSRLISKKIAAAYNRRGIYYFQQGNTRAAIDDLKTALSIDPDYAQVYVNIGIAYMNIADTLSALNAWQQYLKLAPNDPDAVRIRAWCRELTAQ